ncbi:MAG: histidinol dehydrogenase [Christensenellaceae bacterium]|jgi:histidinol dehydrogenase|nr:histidinol dehydrogenase [Christensenellaceae bacterium]
MIRIFDLGELRREDVLRREGALPDVREAVARIIQDVRAQGDAALLRYAAQFDGAGEAPLEVTPAEVEAAAKRVEPALLAIMREAAENIRAYHTKQVRGGFVITPKAGAVLGQIIRPLARVGVYVPGGTACYPSTVLMDALPAKIAGVEEIIMVTPAKGGVIRPEILAAAQIAGVNRIFRTGGAQAVAALAYGTQTIPGVDKIVGPGNAFVAEAKRQVFGQVDIDMIAGPSEILIVAEEGCEPKNIAADMLAQAEHDVFASAVLITPSRALALRVQAELERQLPLLTRAAIARESIDNNGKILLCGSVTEAISLSNELAPEHLELCLQEPFACLPLVQNAGSIFLGNHSPEALGDYFAGPNHTLPTGGTARFASPLSVDDFIKKSSFTYYTAQALGEVAAKVARFAQAEGLDAHAKSVTIRMEQEQ